MTEDNNKKDKHVSALKAAHHALISTAAARDVNANDAVSNTRWFLVEDNENFELSQSDLITDRELDLDPSNPPLKGWNLRYARWLTLRVVQHLAFRLVIMGLIVLDVCLIVADVAVACPPEPFSRISCFVDVILSSLFMLEVAARIFALSPAVFFSRKNWKDGVDFCVVVATFVISVAYVVFVEVLLAEGAFVEEDGSSSCQPRKGMLVLSVSKMLVLVRILRAVRLVRLIRLYTEQHHMKRSIRQTVSQNKRRYQKDGVDLDLTYVTRRIIATSFPSSGLTAWYRNAIADVAAFLDRHHEGHYRVYNLCAERSYDEEWFHNRVIRWPMDDHNVPSVREMVDFIEEVDRWLSSDPANVIAVHCKGGKGRTGTMICILLVHFGLFRDAATSLEYFGQRRTDRLVSAERFQGVETASQIRYVSYFERIMRDPSQRKYPQRTWMKVDAIEIRGLSHVGRGNGSDLTLKVSLGRTDRYVVDFSVVCDEWSSSFDDAKDLFVARVPKCEALVDDVRFKFSCASPKVPRGYERCAFFFWFHTAFVDRDATSTDPKSRRLSLQREHLDNPHKEKTWHVFTSEFQVDVRMTVVDAPQD